MNTDIKGQMSDFQDTFQSKDLCRICLSKSDQMLALHEELGPHTSISVLTALQSVMAVKLNESKAFPQSVCIICKTSLKMGYDLKRQYLKIAYDLKLQYHESDKRITSVLNKAMEELPAIIKVENERVTSGDTVVELTEGQTKYLDSNIVKKELISEPAYEIKLNIKQEIVENIEVPDYVSAEDISTLSHDIKTENKECDLSQIKMETEESNSTSTSSEQTKHVTNNTLEDDLCVEQPEQFICASCNKSCTSKYSLIQHIKQHRKKQVRHACQYCPYQTNLGKYIKRHMLSHTLDKPYACQYCPYKTNRSDNLKPHMLTHTGEKPLACQYCPYKTTHTGNLKKHTLTHTGETPFACMYCPFKTGLAVNLKRHTLTHTGEKPHSCQYCPFKTAQACYLKTHMLRHTGEKPHACQYCPHKATTARNLRLHILTHTRKRPFVCQYCPYKAKRVDSLKLHMLTHTGEKPHACQYCPYKTTQASNLKLHMKTHTGKTWRS